MGKDPILCTDELKFQALVPLKSFLLGDGSAKFTDAIKFHENKTLKNLVNEVSTTLLKKINLDQIYNNYHADDKDKLSSVNLSIKDDMSKRDSEKLFEDLFNQQENGHWDKFSEENLDRQTQNNILDLLDDEKNIYLLQESDWTHDEDYSNRKVDRVWKYLLTDDSAKQSYFIELSERDNASRIECSKIFDLVNKEVEENRNDFTPSFIKNIADKLAKHKLRIENMPRTTIDTLILNPEEKKFAKDYLEKIKPFDTRKADDKKRFKENFDYDINQYISQLKENFEITLKPITNAGQSKVNENNNTY